MGISKQALSNPVAVYMILLGLLVCGIITVLRTDLSLLPAVAVPHITVVTRYPGSGCREIESRITRLLEESISASPGLVSLRASSVDEYSVISARFSRQTEPEQAVSDVRDKIDSCINLLPEDAQRPRVYRYNPQSKPSVIIAFSPVMPELDLRGYMEKNIRGLFERAPGVARAGLSGGHEKEIRIAVKMDALASCRIDLAELPEIIRSANSGSSAGIVQQGNYEYTVRLDGEFRTLHDLRSAAVAYKNGRPVLLSDIADVNYEFKKQQSMVFIGNREQVLLEIYREPGKNPMELTAACRKIARELDVKICRPAIIYEEAGEIIISLRGLAASALLGGIASFAVLWFFFRSFTLPLLVSASIPVSLACACLGFFFTGATLNIMTIGGLCIAVGMALDNSIIVCEAVQSRLSHKTRNAVLSGAQKSESAVTASTVTSLIVFLPLVFIKGLGADFFRELACAVCFTLLASMFVSLCGLPVFMASLPDYSFSGREKKHKQKENVNSARFSGFENFYKKLLGKFLLHKKKWFLLYPLLAVISLACAFFLKKELLPEPPSLILKADLLLPQGTSLERTGSIVSSITEIFSHKTGILTALAGAGREENTFDDIEKKGTHYGYLKFFCSGVKEAADAEQELIDRLSGSGIKFFICREYGPAGDIIQGNKNNYLEFYTDSREKSRQAAELLISRMKEIKIQAQSDYDLERGEIHIIFNRSLAAGLGINAKDTADTLRTALEGKNSGLMYFPGQEIPIHISLHPEDTHKAAGSLRVKSENGLLLPLDLFTEIKRTNGHAALRRKDGRNIIRITFGQEQDRRNINAVQMKKIIELAAAVNSSFQPVRDDQAEELAQNFRETVLALVLSILFVYMFLAASMRSAVEPLAVLLSIPLIPAGVVPALFITGHSLNLFSGLGIIILSGTVVNNAILLHEASGQAKTAREIIEAAAGRLKPVLCTTLTTIFGMLPVALNMLPGTGMQAPLAVTVISGLIVSSLLSLFFVPAFLTTEKHIITELRKTTRSDLKMNSERTAGQIP
ncbi:MAG TPA: hypothetical protein DC049_06645 [Spirochaetia bacterium]|nr:hypothetical protein [Spirochaetia bacterium]